MNIKEMIAIMQAWSEGETIEFKFISEQNWEEATKPIWNWNAYDYRIKPEPKLRPYTIEEFEKLGELVFIFKTNKRRDVVSMWDETGLLLGSPAHFKWADFLEKFTRLDGSPCGVEVTDEA